MGWVPGKMIRRVLLNRRGHGTVVENNGIKVEHTLAGLQSRTQVLGLKQAMGEPLQVSEKRNNMISPRW